MQTKQYISLSVLAEQLLLPKSYLKRLADQKLIPALKVNNRLKFNLESVQAALNELAKGGSHE